MVRARAILRRFLELVGLVAPPDYVPFRQQPRRSQIMVIVIMTVSMVVIGYFIW